MAKTPLTRAEFLKILAAGSAGVLFLGGAEDALAGIAGVNDHLDQAALNGDTLSPRAATKVLAVAKGSDAASNTKRAIAAVGGMKAFVSSGDTVVIKPNICTSRAPKYAATTNPTVVATLVRLAKAAGAGKVLVMDNPISVNPSSAYSGSGIGAAVKAAAGSMVIMGSSGYRNYSCGVLGSFPLYAAVVNADVLINVPILKQHGSTRLTIAGKNLMGCTSNRGKMHNLGLSRSITAVNAKLRPELTVVDAMRILIRNGPTGGNLADVRVKNTVLACRDWVAADTYAAARIAGVAVSAVPYVTAAAKAGLGTTNLASVSIRNV